MGLSTHKSATLTEMQNYLDEHFAEITSISEFAAHFFYTREHVSRLFKKHLNTTVLKYIIKCRIQYSCQLLKTDTPIVDICFQTGFNSVSSFNTAFKRVTGITPSAYRKAHDEISEHI